MKSTHVHLKSAEEIDQTKGQVVHQIMYLTLHAEDLIEYQNNFDAALIAIHGHKIVKLKRIPYMAISRQYKHRPEDDGLDVEIVTYGPSTEDIIEINVGNGNEFLDNIQTHIATTNGHIS